MAIVALLWISGCTTTPSDPPGGPAAGGAGSTVVVDPSQEAGPGLATGEAALYGRVADDAGFSLPEAHVALLDTDHTDLTDSRGRFEFPSLPPGTYRLRIDKTGFRAAQAEVEAPSGVATRLNVTLVPLVDAGAGYRQHPHDYWNGRTEVLVKDSSFDWNPSKPASPVPQTVSRVSYWPNQAISTSCTSNFTKAQGGRSLTAGATTFKLDDPNQTIWPGTAWINISANWADSDYRGTALGFAWRSADTLNWTHGPLVPRGTVYSIPVEPHMSDVAHQVFTLWEFGLCKNDQSDKEMGRIIMGRVHVRATLVRGHEIGPDPPHPKFWENASVPLVDWSRTVTAMSIQRSTRGTNMPIYFPAPRLVPPGTKNVSLWISWEYKMPGSLPPVSALNPPLSLSYSPANVVPNTREYGSEFKRVPPSDSGPNWRLYDVTLLEGENDAYYQTRSNWVLMWGVEGQEDEEEWRNICQCQVSIHVRALAWKDPHDTTHL